MFGLYGCPCGDGVRYSLILYNWNLDDSLVLMSPRKSRNENQMPNSSPPVSPVSSVSPAGDEMEKEEIELRSALLCERN